MPALSVTTQEQHLEALVLFLRILQTAHILFKALPKQLFVIRVGGIGSLDQAKVGLFLSNTLARPYSALT